MKQFRRTDADLSRCVGATHTCFAPESSLEMQKGAPTCGAPFLRYTAADSYGVITGNGRALYFR